MVKRQQTKKKDDKFDKGMVQAAPIAKLPKIFEDRMTGNIAELAMVESNIQSAGKNTRTIYVTSCHNHEGKTTTAIQLAYSLTINANARILLLDGNPRSPILHRMFGVPVAPGLSDFIYSDAEPDVLFHETAYTNLSLLTFGNTSHPRPFFIQEDHFKKFEALTKEFDYVIFDSNRILGSSDSILISNLFDGVILTIACEKTKWEVVLQAIDKLKNIGAQVLGVVLNNRKYYVPEIFYGRR